ncbi:MAG: type II toxin-antitoxin system RelE/ParE family toxin [Verrucomicrobia bacterium]|nr:type II toxin-antitoxin system RelE/ParE family toxin [Verrucomicrobiota bacterium]
MRFEFHPDAITEYTHAATYYAQQQDGLQHRFIKQVELTIQDILSDPKRYRLFEEDVRRCLTPVFPYAILYTIEPNFIHIIAVTHCARQPGYWMERLADA